MAKLPFDYCPDFLTDNPGNIHKVTTTASSWKCSCPDGNRWFHHRCL